jgi:hypothetical protein
LGPLHPENPKVRACPLGLVGLLGLLRLEYLRDLGLLLDQEHQLDQLHPENLKVRAYLLGLVDLLGLHLPVHREDLQHLERR